ncbi:hypothetical protein BTN50_1024 [Candidatus Enterovibrio altilux]|uniref:Uncharacterized protein n=1 Tax=Candidatus Enterovibrio altilux TaxID=1927128 RepID=A0A291B934_9GAMM|nr:hypothetical protein BTN50_1024 [Candidatus Enterovibrio luxaltus]
MPVSCFAAKLIHKLKYLSKPSCLERKLLMKASDLKNKSVMSKQPKNNIFTKNVISKKIFSTFLL